MATQPPTPPPPEDPHAGSEDDPPREVERRADSPVVPPRRYEVDGGTEAARPTREPTVLDRLESASGPLALIVFFLIGFGTGKWYIAWVVFLLPAVLHAWNRPSTKR